MRTTLLVVFMLATVTTAQDRSAQRPTALDDPVLQGCTAMVKQPLDLSARDSGALVEFVVEEGSVVQKGDFLGQIEDTEAVMARAVAEAQLKTAVENAGEGSRIQIDYAQKAAALAEQEYRTNEDAYNKARAVTWMDLERSRLEWVRAQAQIDVRKLEQTLADYELIAKQAEVTAAEQVLQRRRLTAPFPGIVVKTYRREGEWAQVGEPILQLMNFETMVVKGTVNSKYYRRHQIAGRPVTVEIQLPGPEQARFQGRITHVSPIEDSRNQEFAVQAEVENRQEQGHWLLPHAATVTMTIHVN